MLFSNMRCIGRANVGIFVDYFVRKFVGYLDVLNAIYAKMWPHCRRRVYIKVGYFVHSETIYRVSLSHR